jgi:hypothetical protein
MSMFGASHSVTSASRDARNSGPSHVTPPFRGVTCVTVPIRSHRAGPFAGFHQRGPDMTDDTKPDAPNAADLMREIQDLRAGIKADSAELATRENRAWAQDLSREVEKTFMSLAATLSVALDLIDEGDVGKARAIIESQRDGIEESVERRRAHAALNR